MYKIYDKKEAVRQVQIYLAETSNTDAYIAPTGVYDEATLKAVLNFQKANGLDSTGVVDKETFDSLYNEYSLITERNRIKKCLNAFLHFPILPGDYCQGIEKINYVMSALLDYYGYSHSIRKNNYYSSETAEYVRILRNIYLLEDMMQIDEMFYQKIMRDYNSLFQR